MPITAHATIGPMEQVWALGWLINRLLEKRPTTFMLVGTWLLALPILCSGVGLVLGFSLQATMGDMLLSGMAALATLLVNVCYLLLALRVTVRYVWGDREPWIHCADCGYDMRGHPVGATCPECGSTTVVHRGSSGRAPTRSGAHE